MFATMMFICIILGTNYYMKGIMYDAYNCN